MTVKFKVGLVITGETVFALLSKFLPIEDLEVEELLPEPAERVVRIAAAPPRKLKRASRGPNLKKGINGIVVTALKDAPKRAIELQPLIKAAGFSKNSLNSRLESLHKLGVLSRTSDGRWKLNG